MKRLSRLLAVKTILGLSASLSAQTTADPMPHGPGGRGPGGHGGHGGPGGPGRGHPIVRVLDNDQDGVISATELGNAPSNIRTLDLNGDGNVSAAELHPARPADAPTPPADRPAPTADDDHPRPVDPIMLALDANKDGGLSMAEITNATASLKALDLNADGQLTPDEYRPLPPAGAPGAGGPPHFGPPRPRG